MKFEMIEGKLVLYIHQSDLTAFRQCPEQLRLKLRDEYYDPDSDSAYIGTLTHRFAEWALNHYVTEGRWPQQDLCAGQFNILASELATAWPTLWHHPHQIEDLQAGIQGMARAINHWWENFPRLVNTDKVGEWLIEPEFDYPIGRVTNTRVSVEVRLRGRIDFWDGDRIWDFKTGSLREAWRKLRYDVQSTIYTWGLGKRLDRDIHNFSLVYCPREQGKKFDVCEITRGEGHWRQVQIEALAVANMAIEQLGRPKASWPLGHTDWWCSSRWCSEHAQGRCMGFDGTHSEDAHNLTRLIEMGHKPSRHDASFDKGIE